MKNLLIFSLTCLFTTLIANASGIDGTSGLSGYMAFIDTTRQNQNVTSPEEPVSESNPERPAEEKGTPEEEDGEENQGSNGGEENQEENSEEGNREGKEEEESAQESNNDSSDDNRQEDEDKEEPKPSYWSSGGQTTLGFSQISLSNWASGGHESQSFNTRFNSFVNYKTPGNKTTWENTLDIRYGLINQKDRQTVKSDDLLDFSSKFGLRASEHWSYSSLLSFRTQFAQGFRRPTDTVKISDFMAPAYLNISIGMDHKFDDNISFYMSPLAGRVTYVLDEYLSQAGAFGVEEGKNRRYEFGGFVRVMFSAELIENITAQSKLELFSNYLEKPQNLTINSDTRINMRINQYISANLDIHMRYDENATIRVDTTGDGQLDTTLPPRIQIKQVFGLGLSYSF